MKRFIFIIILIFSFQSWTKADDISDFEIEGMSIGDSALNFFNEEQIEANKYFAYPLKDYFQSFIMTPDSQMYTSIQFSIKNGDNDFIMVSIEGGIHPIEFNKCKKRKKIIEKEILEVFPDLTNVIYGKERKMWSDPDSKEITTDIYINTSFTDGGAIRIVCVDRSKRIEEEKGWVDSLRVIANSKEFNIFIDKSTSLND